jgi:hypothetical protein
LNLSSELTRATRGPAVIKSRIQALLDMVKVNLSIQMIHVASHYSNHELFQGSVAPYLETNRLRPRLLASPKARPISYRAKVLGRALLSARTNANIFWMLLSGNAEVAFPSTAATTTPAVTTAAPATSAATPSNDSASGVSDPTVAVAANDAISSAGQKRKARL